MLFASPERTPRPCPGAHYDPRSRPHPRCLVPASRRLPRDSPVHFGNSFPSTTNYDRDVGKARERLPAVRVGPYQGASIEVPRLEQGLSAQDGERVFNFSGTSTCRYSSPSTIGLQEARLETIINCWTVVKPAYTESNANHCTPAFLLAFLSSNRPLTSSDDAISA